MQTPPNLLVYSTTNEKLKYVDLYISALKFLSESDHSQWHKQVNSSYDVHVKGLTTRFVLDKVISWQWDMNNFVFQPEP